MIFGYCCSPQDTHSLSWKKAFQKIWNNTIHLQNGSHNSDRRKRGWRWPVLIKPFLLSYKLCCSYTNFSFSSIISIRKRRRFVSRKGEVHVSKEIGDSVFVSVWRHVSRQWLSEGPTKCSSKRWVKTSNISVSVSVYCFAISCTKARKFNYLNSHGEEAQEKPPGL